MSGFCRRLLRHDPRGHRKQLDPDSTGKRWSPSYACMEPSNPGSFDKTPASRRKLVQIIRPDLGSSARCSSRLSGGLSTTTGTAGCPCSLPRLRRRSWRAATQSGVCAEAHAGCVVAPVVVSSRKRRPPGRTRVATQLRASSVASRRALLGWPVGQPGSASTGGAPLRADGGMLAGMNSTNFCKDHMNPNGFTSDPVLATEGVPPDERPKERPEIPERPIPKPGPPAPALQVTPGIPGR
jgi:hypothetical protein